MFRLQNGVDVCTPHLYESMLTVLVCEGNMSSTTPQSEEAIPPVPAAVRELIKYRVKHLGLRKTDKQQSARLVNNLRDSLLDFLKKNNKQPYLRSVTVLNSGSYYEIVKVGNPCWEK